MRGVSAAPLVRVVVLNWNSAWLTTRCVRSLLATNHPLDRPAWTALTGRQSTLASGDAHAVRLDPAMGVFLAGADASAASVAAMADLIAAQHNIAQMDRELAMVEAELTYAEGVAARSEKLIDVGAISRQEFENDRAMARSQTAKREAARAKVEQLYLYGASGG